ncbi:MAG: alpha/beta fold hydrolase [Woeseia sp.]
MSAAPEQELFFIHGPEGPLEALLETPPSGELTGGVVVCHPHPQHGGAMQNKVAHTLARAFVGCGFAALRFNFRGVGRSAGEFAEGEGELLDALAAAGTLQERIGSRELWFAGFSFGAAIAIRAAAKGRVRGLVSVAPAVSRVAQGSDPQPDCPWLIVQGAKDELVSVNDTVEWVNSLEPGPELQIFEDTEHFFHGKLVMLRKAVESFIKEQRRRT